ncbi:MAG: hypothetical protein EXR79_07790 [Myxococcales bacterium]|nr:hypothetical protein [Myxococcales bacterium]
MSLRPPPIVRAVEWRWRIGAGAACALAGGIGGLAWGHVVPAGEAPEVALRLAFALGLPWPLVLLGSMTRPTQRQARSLLGQPAGAQIADGVGRAGQWLGVALVAPAALGAVCLLQGEVTGLAALCVGPLNGAAPPALALPAMLAAGMVGAFALGVAAIASALAAMGRGVAPAWATVAGGGAFGPATAAPLLYAPAAAQIAALLPIGMLAALWQAWSGLVSQQVLAGLAIGVCAAEVGVAAGAWRRARPWLHAGLVAVDEAHAVRFLTHEDRSPAPAWLVPRRASAGAHWFAMAWHRAAPDPLLITLGSVGGVALLLGSDAHAGAAAAGAGVIATHAGGRAIRALPAWPPARWLGLAPTQAGLAMSSLAWRLVLPAATLVGLAGLTGHWLAVVLGTAAGSVGGVIAVRMQTEATLRACPPASRSP